MFRHSVAQVHGSAVDISEELPWSEKDLGREEARARVTDSLRKPQLQGSRSLKSRPAVSMMEEVRTG